MKRIVCFGDSNTHGYDAVTNGRFDENTRWTCLLQKMAGPEYMIIEEGLSGRTACFEDPLYEGMCGLNYLYPCLMSHELFDTLIIMLGTNDCKERFSATPHNIANAMRRLVQKAKGLPVWNGAPHIIVVAPPPILPECETSAVGGEMGKDSSAKSYKLAEEYRAMAQMEKVDFLDAAGADMNHIDFMHLSPDGHRFVAELIWKKLQESN